MLRNRPQIKDVHVWARLVGESVEKGSARVELLATKVIPQAKAALTGGSDGVPVVHETAGSLVFPLAGTRIEACTVR